jgi:EmrB/QacA subfamily drug resistance transporter
MSDSTVSANRMRMAMTVSALAIFMANLDVSIVNIALPSLAKLYGTDATGISAIVLGYMLTLTGLLLVAGKLSDAKSPERVLCWGFWIFIISSVLCALAPSLNGLIIFRILQGIGGAFLFATSSVIVVQYVPADRRGRAYSLNGLLAGVAVAFGAPIGGFLLQHWGWRWIFLINIPIGLIALGLAKAAFIRRSPTPLVSLDWPGAAYSFTALTALLYGLHQSEDSGWSSAPVMTALALAGLFLLLFLWQEQRCPSPLLDLQLFRNRHLSAAMAGNFFYLMLVGGLTFVLPFYLIHARQMSPQDAGLIMMISPGISIIVSRLSGSLSDRIGPRNVCITAAFCMALSSFGIVTFTSVSPFVWVAGLLVLLGIGRALYVTAVLTMIMSFSEKGKEGMLSAAKALIPNLGSALGVSLSAILYNSPLNVPGGTPLTTVDLVVSGFRAAALFGAVIAVLAVAASLLADAKKLNPPYPPFKRGD